MSNPTRKLTEEEAGMVENFVMGTDIVDDAKLEELDDRLKSRGLDDLANQLYDSLRDALLHTLEQAEFRFKPDAREISMSLMLDAIEKTRKEVLSGR